MDFDLPDTALAVRDGVSAVGAKYDHAYWSRCDEEHRFPQEAWRDLADGGWIGLCVPEEYGGAANARLSRPEQVKKFELLPVDWTAESAALTPTLKLKRRVVHAKYSDVLERLYQ